MIAVIDASAAVDLLVSRRLAGRVREVVVGYRLHAPGIVDLEVAGALARLERARTLTAAQAETALALWLDAAVVRVEPKELTAAAFAQRASLRVSDAFYVALARALAAPLITTDHRLARAPLTGLTVIAID
jgi:predicted nucleic acid-binding protein